jgi:putative transposase
VTEHYDCVLEIVRRSDDVKGFVVLPHRWGPEGAPERTLGWLNRWRRLSKDYEYLPGVSEHLIYLALIAIMVRRLSV